jgi:phage tail-like protein
MTVGERTDPYRSFNFEVVIDGEPVGSFSEASGLVADGDTTDYREGTDPENSVRKLTGLRKYPNITLRRGYTRSTASGTAAAGRSCCATRPGSR